MTSEVEKYRQAREMLARPGGWTQGASARDALGQSVFSDDPSAVCWCAFGALCFVGNTHVSWLHKAVSRTSITPWNDDPFRTQADVVAAFDRAIALIEASEAA